MRAVLLILTFVTLEVVPAQQVLSLQGCDRCCRIGSDKEFVWGVFGVFVWPGVVGKLCHRQELFPVVLSSVDKVAQVGFYPLVHSLRLSISSRVKCGTDVLSDACRFAHCFAKVTGESWISICYDPFRNTVCGEEMLEVEVRYALTIYGLVTGQEFRCFGTALIYNCEYSIILFEGGRSVMRSMDMYWNGPCST
jgi:hypothetical protein